MSKEILRFDRCQMGRFSTGRLRDFYFHVNSGSITSLIGVSGSGKTILYEYFIGRISLNEGEARFDGHECRAGERFPYVSQVICLGRQSTLIPGLSVAENIFIVNSKRKASELVWMPNIIYRARLLLGQFAPDISPEVHVRNLRPAQKIVVELLRAIENEVKLVYIDDVFEGFGQRDMSVFLELLQVMKNRGISIIYACHNLNLITRNSDRICVIRRGQIVRHYFVDTFQGKQLRTIMLGKDAGGGFKKVSHVKDRVVLKIERGQDVDWNKRIRLEANMGEIIGFYDMNNIDNIRFLDEFMGRVDSDKLDVSIDGRQYIPKGFDRAIKSGIGYLSRDFSAEGLVNTMTYKEDLSLPLIVRNRRESAFRARKISSFIDREYGDRLVLSKWQRMQKLKDYDRYSAMKVYLMRWLLFRPKVMVCIEPLVDADIRMRDDILNFLTELASQGTVVMIASQNMDDLRLICDSLYILNEKADEVEKYMLN